MSAETKTLRTAAETALIERFDAVKAALPGAAEVGKLREDAFAEFTASGLPHRRVEEWKYTDLRALMREAAPFAAKPDDAAAQAILASAAALSGISASVLAFANGHLVGSPAPVAEATGAEITALGEALASGHPLLSEIGKVEVARGNSAIVLNTAFMADGAIIRVPKGVAAKPLYLKFANAADAPFATAPRLLVVLEEGASLDLVESHEGQDGLAYQANSVIEVVLGDKAKLSHARLNAEGAQAQALSTLSVSLGAEADFTSLNLVAGAALSRHQVFVAFAGEGAKASVGGATMIAGRQHADTTLVVDHAVPSCESKELFKTVLDGESVGVFQGNIIVRQFAQKTDGRMMSASLLLSENATMNNKPELVIFADDVQCAHGATCGALDEEMVFYLMARGIPKKQAESLMVQAFLGEAIELVEAEDVRDALIARAEAWLAARA